MQAHAGRPSAGWRALGIFLAACFGALPGTVASAQAQEPDPVAAAQPSAAPGLADRLRQERPGKQRADASGRLVSVNLSGMTLSDQELTELAGMTSVTSLLLGDTDISDDDLRRVAGMRQLETLGLRGTAITDAGVAHLAALTGLRELFLADTGITDGALAALSGLSGLENLGLRDTAISDAGLEHVWHRWAS